MPTTYTHDVFGKMVYQKLPENLKEIVEEHMNAYRIGQHGPDILFYYHLFHENPVNQKGMAMHEQIAASFFRKCKEYCQETGDEEALAYVFGFICHYMLDSTCHPYIAKYMEKTGARHDEIETELDRYLMERSGKNPFRFKPGSPAESIKRERACGLGHFGTARKDSAKKHKFSEILYGNYGVPQISKEDAFAVGDAADRSL